MAHDSEADRERDLFFIMGSLFRAIVRTARKDLLLSGLDITFEQSMILMVLGCRDGQSQQQLAEATNKDRPSITRLIDTMVENDLVQRVMDTRDHRINLIRLTDKGRSSRKKMITRSRDHMQELLRDVREEDLQIWLRVMGQLSANNGRVDERLARRLEQLQLETKLKIFKKSAEIGELQ